MMIVRSFVSEDVSSCEEIYRANLDGKLVPRQYFKEFVGLLGDSSCLTLVGVKDGKVVACGSVSYERQRASAWLSYGLVHPEYQRRGIGSTMLLTRMSLLEAPPDGACSVFLSATRNSKTFFAKHGFGWRGSESDSYGNEFETFCLPLTESLIVACRKALERAQVQYDANLNVPNAGSG